MAQKVTGIIKLQINAAKATASPPVGPALGQHGVNIAAFIKEFNARTQSMEGYKIPVVITVYADRSFTFITKTPPTPLLVMKAIGLDKGSGVPNKTKVGTITKAQITESGVSKTYDRKVYPGYVLVKMVYSDDTWHVIRNVRGVTGFVGTSSNDPTPLTEEEVYAMGVEKKEIIVNYVVGDTVRILDGPLSSFTGRVDNIEVDKNLVSVVVSMFGRETSVEFELDQVEVISQ